VLTKAIPVFWKRGFVDTKVEDLEEADVNKSGLFGIQTKVSGENI
jgi:hypothetical protein